MMLTYLLDILCYLLFVKEKLSVPHRTAVKDSAFLIGRNVHSIDIHLTGFHPYECLFDTALSHAERFDLRTVKHDPRFIFLEYEIVMICFFIIRDQFCL